ncbi:MAG: peptidoglycan DD-metalloendopeptidase family protein [Kineosporiaceae bacterium]|nr:peptidoglycan DD-metalloendopeptidase family protein [Kineosporiaceae bacterium]MBK7621444.1 peptidoglycan DD-metalloendopeptidase family protein [Kineosporiaceae bacterium]MBK8077398.1 peptidoglycan DD-metalloendopeptidase family protein [Kineosporiaceae bacterium]
MASRFGRRALASVGAAALFVVPGLTCAGMGPVGAAQAASHPLADDIDQRKKDVDSAIADLRESLEGANADFVEAAIALKRAEQNLVVARASLATAQGRLAQATAQDAHLAAQLEVARAEEGKAERDLQAQATAEDETRKALGDIARQAYVGSDINGLSILLQADSPEHLSERLAYAGAALRAQNGAIDRLAVQQAEMRARGSRLAAVRAQIAELKRQSTLVVAARRAAEQQAATAEAEVTTLVATQQGAVTTIQGKIAAEKKRLDELAAEQSKLRAILAERARKAREAARKRARQGGGGGGDSGGQRASNGFFGYPSSGRISSGFGMRYHPILHYSRMHTGTDFAAGCGTAVYAAADGEIISAGWAGGYGNRVIIDHGLVNGADLATTYNHLSRIVRGGGSVSRGQVIGYVGTTGLSTGCHLHFEALVDGNYANPMRWL